MLSHIYYGVYHPPSFVSDCDGDRLTLFQVIDRFIEIIFTENHKYLCKTLNYRSDICPYREISYEIV